ncbi:Hint domain-containing protein [Aliiroseovarius sp. KMU-50]|uniref:Hint domain-containing protein n=1 Tax=Aliiroseovarius salicola TaxID=3009082 RepID=A0ABT4W1T2_9RHOB|nr:Hint domain-containing protein [Aliiroseovarius sp. KMU-50]MDA5094384.1 Hint domain-containing protein [Aliiroseovarius sp. KMU-50]
MTVHEINSEFEAFTSAKAGLAKGTIILTLRGEVAVEDLCEGDRIITRGIGAQPLRAIHQHNGNAAVVRKNSLGENRPERDMRVAPDQALFLRGDTPTLTKASKMAKEIVKKTTLYRLVFDRPHVIYADGAELAVA